LTLFSQLTLKFHWPACVLVSRQIDTYERLYTEVEQMESCKVFENWFRVDTKPFKQALLNTIRKWGFMFKQHLVDHVNNRFFLSFFFFFNLILFLEDCTSINNLRSTFQFCYLILFKTFSFTLLINSLPFRYVHLLQYVQLTCLFKIIAFSHSLVLEHLFWMIERDFSDHCWLLYSAIEGTLKPIPLSKANPILLHLHLMTSMEVELSLNKCSIIGCCQYLYCSLRNLSEFISSADKGLTQPIKEGDYKTLIGVMGQLMAVKERQSATDDMFEPLKETIELLKTYNQDLMPDEVHLQLQVQTHWFICPHVGVKHEDLQSGPHAWWGPSSTTGTTHWFICPHVGAKHEAGAKPTSCGCETFVLMWVRKRSLASSV